MYFVIYSCRSTICIVSQKLPKGEKNIDRPPLFTSKVSCLALSTTSYSFLYRQRVCDFLLLRLSVLARYSISLSICVSHFVLQRNT